MSSTSSRTFAIVPHRFIQTRPGFEANGVEVQLHVDVRMHAPKGWNSDHENKIREIFCRGPSAKIYTLKIYPLYGIRDKDNLVWISVEDSDSDKERCRILACTISLYLATLPMHIVVYSLYFKSWQASDRKKPSFLMSGRTPGVGLTSRQTTVFEIKPIQPVAAL